mmetsp:Transcript_22315/g.60266  ORF Transcript_22315/g.60266 Transcript_22315/m.60266 type:complete len:205 (-) Transcript_22315:71-685(-)
MRPRDLISNQVGLSKQSHLDDHVHGHARYRWWRRRRRRRWRRRRWWWRRRRVDGGRDLEHGALGRDCECHTHLGPKVCVLHNGCATRLDEHIALAEAAADAVARGVNHLEHVVRVSGHADLHLHRATGECRAHNGLSAGLGLEFKRSLIWVVVRLDDNGHRRTWWQRRGCRRIVDQRGSQAETQACEGKSRPGDHVQAHAFGGR